MRSAPASASRATNDTRTTPEDIDVIATDPASPRRAAQTQLLHTHASELASSIDAARLVCGAGSM